LTEAKRTPLHFACTNAHVDIVNILLEHSADVNVVESKDGETPLHRAAAIGNLPIMQLLIQAKADCNIVNRKHRTALHNIAKLGHYHCAHYLISLGVVDADIKDRRGKKAYQLVRDSNTRFTFNNTARLQVKLEKDATHIPEVPISEIHTAQETGAPESLTEAEDPAPKTPKKRRKKRKQRDATLMEQNEQKIKLDV
jgi:26S proteasome non-ATPase regulatory subunit 10